MIPEWLCQDRSVLEESARRMCMTANLGDNRLACRVLGKYIMFVEPEDRGITPHLALNGYWESWITLAIARLVRPGWRCIDVGANVGYYALLLADAVGAEGRVLAVEPNPTVARWLALNMEVNGFSGWVDIERCVVAEDKSEIVDLFVERSRPGNATICTVHDPLAERISVRSSSIDELALNWPRVDLVKIDAEGAEPAIWKGMRHTLSRNRDIIVLMEFTPSRYADPASFLGEIRSDGFSVRQVAEDGTMIPLPLEDIERQLACGEWTMLFLVRD
jgi:FkbM family methyltransferase